jgi:hypothetical protein
MMFMAVGGIKSGEPTGWGVMVCEKAKLTMSNSVIEYAHQVKGKRWCASNVLFCVAETCSMIRSLTCLVVLASLLVQALSVVDWCRARVQDCRFEHLGNALWFGNRVQTFVTYGRMQH